MPRPIISRPHGGPLRPQDDRAQVAARLGRRAHLGGVATSPTSAPRRYVLEMLPYPSGEPHIGHLKTYSVGDAVAHFRRRNGHRVLHPMGYDAFGLPAENHAIKTGQHPRESTEASIARVPAPVPRAGASRSTGRASSAPTSRAYYRWTQWIFLRLFERGLAYRKEAAVKWCPNDADRARQRAGDRRALRALRHAGRGAPARAVVLPHHRLRRPPARRHARRSTGRATS